MRTGGQLNGVAANGSMDLAPYWGGAVERRERQFTTSLH